MLTITLLGTGALQPLPNRHLASCMLTCEGRQILIDCGEGTQAAIRKAGMGLTKIDLIALTHYHGDHTYGLPGLLQSMSIAGRTEKLYLAGPEGLEDALLPFRMLCPALPFPVETVSVPREGLSLGSLLPCWKAEARLASFATVHHGGSQGYRFDHLRNGFFEVEKAIALNIPRPLWKVLQHGESIELHGRTIHPEDVLGKPRKGLSLAYTGDTAFDAGMAQAVQNVDLLIAEATYGENEQEGIAKERTHMTFAQAANLAQLAHAAELWLTHYSPIIDDPNEFLPNATAVFENTVCGIDGLQKTLAFEERKQKT